MNDLRHMEDGIGPPGTSGSTRIVSKYTNKSVKKGLEPRKNLSRQKSKIEQMLDQKEIDIYVRLGFRAVKTHQSFSQ